LHLRLRLRFPCRDAQHGYHSSEISKGLTEWIERTTGWVAGVSVLSFLLFLDQRYHLACTHGTGEATVYYLIRLSEPLVLG
jgi:hypothetical protein